MKGWGPVADIELNERLGCTYQGFGVTKSRSRCLKTETKYPFQKHLWSYDRCYILCYLIRFESVIFPTSAIS